MSFPEFVAIKLGNTHERTTAYKAMASFASSVDEVADLPVEDTIRAWIATMIDKGIAPASRKRYVEKLGTIYREFAGDLAGSSDPFGAVRDLRDFEVSNTVAVLDAASERMAHIFDILMSEARANPVLAVFVYLLFHASSDIDAAISLTIDEYAPEFPQLDEIINPAKFHHRRKYVFDLDQSRKRMPQLRSEVISTISFYLRAKEILLPGGFAGSTIPALWVARAKSIGIPLAAIVSALADIPTEYLYIKYIKGVPLAPDRAMDIKQRVAESFAPTVKRWYALKLRRSVRFEALRDYFQDIYGERFDPQALFYPRKEVSRRMKKKIVTEEVPVIPDVVFLHVQPGQVRRIDMLIKNESYGWVFRMANKADSEYSVIDPASMLVFQRVIGTFTPDIKVALTRENPIGIGRRVRITGGIWEGYTGIIYDVKPGSSARRIYIRLSDEYCIRAEATVEEYYVECLD